MNQASRTILQSRGAFAALIAAGLAIGGCVSSTDIDALSDQIADVQRQASQMQQQGSSKQEVAQLEATIQRQTDALLKAEADMRLDINSLSAQIAQLQDKLEDTNYRLAQVSQQIAATNQDLKASRTVPPVPGAAADGSQPPARSGLGSGDSLPDLLQRLSARQLRPRDARLQAVSGGLSRDRPDGQRHLLDRRVPLSPAEIRRGHCGVRPGTQAVSAQRQDRERAAQEGLRAPRTGTEEGRHRRTAERGQELSVLGRGQPGQTAPAGPRR